MQDYTTKRLEFEKNIDLIENLIKVVSDTDILDTQDVENYYRNADRIINGCAIDNAWKATGLKGKLKELFSESIHQAVAEERARAVEIVSFIDYDFLADLSNEEKYPIEYAIYSERKRIQLALASSQDKPLTNKDI